ncbi:hypothetical protein C8R44DRAFT_865916 [Mycena epipterygia]|nr:hypothetical protein C8R44DRAFT_865916 [Mycena epipterygia]
MVLTPEAFPAATYVPWVDGIRLELGANDAEGNPQVTQNGTATPAVNPPAPARVVGYGAVDGGEPGGE